MEVHERISVTILYRHQLFGEGIAHFLASEPDMAVECVAIGPDDAPADALASRARPDVVIVERTDRISALELLQAFSDVLVIDIALDPGPTFAWRRLELGSDPEAIIRTIHELTGSRLGAAASADAVGAADAGSRECRSSLAVIGPA